MRVILREEMDHLGQAGELVTVRDGYARNYLLPRGIAVRATEKDMARLEHERREIAIRAAKRAKELEKEVDRLSKLSVSIARAVGEEDRLYGSVTSRDIAEAVAEQGVEIDSKKLQLPEPIKALGLHEVPLKLGRDAIATIKVWVVKKE